MILKFGIFTTLSPTLAILQHWSFYNFDPILGFDIFTTFIFGFDLIIISTVKFDTHTQTHIFTTYVTWNFFNQCGWCTHIYVTRTLHLATRSYINSRLIYKIIYLYELVKRKWVLLVLFILLISSGEKMKFRSYLTKTLNVYSCQRPLLICLKTVSAMHVVSIS